MAVAGTTIELTRGAQRAAACRALPVSGRGPGVVVVHDGFGLDAFVRDTCGRLSRAGFSVVAPDLDAGRTEADPKRAERVAAERKPTPALAWIDVAMGVLLDHDATDGPRIGLLGLGSGGVLALRAAAQCERSGAVVDLGGVPGGDELAALDPEALSSPVLAIFGEREAAVADGTVERFERQLRAGGVALHIHRQPGMGEAFVNESRADRFDALAAASAWDAAIAFLRAGL